MAEVDNSPEQYEINFIEQVNQIIRFFKIRFNQFIIYCIGGVLIGLAAYFFTDKRYTSSLLLKSEIPHDYTYMDQMFNTFIDEKNYTELSKQLNLSIKEVEYLKSIDIKKKDIIEKEVINRDPNTPLYNTINVLVFDVTVLVTNQDILPKLRDGIVNHFYNNPYVKKIIEQKKQNYNNIIKSIDTELILLRKFRTDSVFILYNPPKPKKDNDVMIWIDPSNIHKTVIELNETKINMKTRLDAESTIYIVKDFQRHKQGFPNLLMMLVLGVGVSTVLFVFVHTLISKKNINKHRK